MRDDYLWDRSGAPDPEVARLEEVLHPLGQGELPPLALPAPPTRGWGAAVLSWAAAALVALAIGGWWLVNRGSSRPGGWEITRLDASSKTGRVTTHGQLVVGSWLETSGEERASVKVANIGTVVVEPRTRVRLLDTRAGDHRLQLARGTLRATILAPPGQFFVETPSSTAVDLGCAYTLTVDEEGAGLIEVLVGWVGFEWRGRESFIPAGSMCPTRRDIGPGTPYNEHVSPAFREALATIDFRSGSPDVKAAIAMVVAEALERDEVTLWHLLSRVAPEDRDRVFDRLAAFAPPPSGITREGIRAGRRDMLDTWWDAFGLGSISLWRTWKQSWPDPRGTK